MHHTLCTMQGWAHHGHRMVPENQSLAKLWTGTLWAKSTMHCPLCTVHYALSTMHYALCTMHYVLCTLQGWLVGTSWAQRHGESWQDRGGLLCHASCNIFASQNLQALISQRPPQRESPEVKRHIDQKSAMVIVGLASERSGGVEKVNNAERAVSTCLLVCLSAGFILQTG